ncbi:hypothetical protein GGI04_001248 [Coemansia thaxteri]|nr:hypothetical protein GGI04_001248 [Coemansia thaxteri]KAJ2473049.1 hypothetical protein GGI02_001151 [Coemansia sp. RSA 2322]
MPCSVNSGVKPIRIAVAGGNYAGLYAIQELYASLLAKSTKESPSERPPVEITLIDRRDGFVHYIGITRGQTEPLTFGAELWVPYATVPWLQHAQIRVIQATVVKITQNTVELATNGEGNTVEFDYVIIALGESRFAPVGVASSTKAEFIKELAESHGRIQAAQSVVVVGGGAVGIEMAADIKSDFPDKQVTLIHSRALPIPGPFKDEFRRSVVDILQRDIGVDVVLGERVVRQTPESADMRYSDWGAAFGPEVVQSVSHDSKIDLELSSGRHIQADYVIRCVGTDRKHRVLSIKGDVFGSRGIRVRDTMQIDGEYSGGHMFACGDICARDEVKLAGVAMYGGYIAGRNVARLVLGLDSSRLEAAIKYPSKLLLLMGKKQWAFQMDDEIWDRERTRQHVHEDMGLAACVDRLALQRDPEFSDLSID